MSTFSTNRTASANGGCYCFGLPTELCYHAEGPACPEWAREGSRFFGAFFQRCDAALMAYVKVDQMLNLAMKIGKACTHLCAEVVIAPMRLCTKPGQVVFIDKNPDKDTEKEQEKRGVLHELIQNWTPAAGCRYSRVYGRQL